MSKKLWTFFLNLIIGGAVLVLSYVIAVIIIGACIVNIEMKKDEILIGMIAIVISSLIAFIGIRVKTTINKGKEVKGFKFVGTVTAILIAVPVSIALIIKLFLTIGTNIIGTGSPFP